MSRDKQNIKTTDWLTRGMTEEELAREKEKAIKKAEAELRNKRIEEIQKEIIRWGENADKTGNYRYNLSEHLHDAGYRKSTDVAEEIFAEIEKAIYHLETPIGKYLVINNGRLAELKKKYESEKDNG